MKLNYVVRWCVVLSAVLALTGCGGGASTEVQSAPVAGSASPVDVRNVVAGAATNPTDGSPPSAPVSPQLDRTPDIVQFEQISAVRVDRTKYDYTFALHIKGTSQNIRDAEFVVTSKLPYTQVSDGSSKLLSIDAGRLIRSSDVIVVRHDRTYPFNFSNLQVAFSGQPVAEAAGQITIGAIDFLELAGRAGHEGYLEIQTSAPAAGRQLLLRATIAGGATAARYSLFDLQGRAISSGDLSNPWTGQLYFVGFVQAPSVPFSIKVEASDYSGRATSYQTSAYVPSSAQIQLKVKNGAFEYGQHITGSVRVYGPPGSMLPVKLLVPEGFTAAPGSWSVPVPSSGTVEVPFDVATSNTGDRAKFYDLVVVSNGSSAATRVFAK